MPAASLAKAAPKETASYRLPTPLVRSIASFAGGKGVRPCVVAEQLIRQGIKYRKLKRRQAQSRVHSSPAVES